MPNSAQKAGMLPNLIAALGFVVLAAIVIWGFVHLITLAQPWLKSLTGGGNTITVSAPKTVAPNTPATVSWKYSPTVAGSYALLYQCKDGATFAAQDGAPFPCGIAQSMGTNTQAVLIPQLSGTATSVVVPLSVIFTPSATGTRAEGGATITITFPTTSNTAAATNTVTTLPTPVMTSALSPSSSVASPTPAAATSSLPDLSVRIVAIGTIGDNGDFVAEAPEVGGRAAVRFDIANNGAAPTGPWNFSAHLPSGNGYDYTSPTQVSLQPKGHILNTLTFSDYTPGGMASITVDPENKIKESNKANNAVSHQM